MTAQISDLAAGTYAKPRARKPPMLAGEGDREAVEGYAADECTLETRQLPVVAANVVRHFRL